MAVPAQARPLESTSAELGVQPQDTPNVISYLSQGIQGEAVKSRQSVQAPLVIPYLSQGLTAADAEPTVIPDAFERAVVSQGPAVHPESGIPLSAGIPHPGDPFVAEPAKTTYTIEPGRSWYLVGDPAPARPDDRIDRFVVGDGTPAPTVSDGDGFALDWENGVTFGLGALALALALAIATMYRRPRVAL